MARFMEFITIKENFRLPGVLLAIGILWVYRLRGMVYLIAAGLTVGLADTFTHHIIKDLVARPRPCHVLPELSHIINCSNSYSFPSNHAVNSFTFATFTTLCYRNTVLLVYTLAALICYSRPYLGVHYPTDVLGGAVCGIVMGYLGYLVYLKIPWTNPRLQ